MKKRIWRLAAAALWAGTLAATLSPTSQAITVSTTNLVTNGGFESGLTGWTTSNFLLQGFDYGIDGVAHTPNNAFFGGAVGDLGFLSQSIATVPGVGYVLTYWLQSSGSFENEFRVAANGQVLTDQVDTLVGPYLQQTLIFDATAATTTLQFGFRDDSFAFHIDDISVTVPEPASLALLGIGLGAIGFARRRQA